MVVTHKVQGLAKLERDLQALGKHTTAKGVARRVLKKAGEPIAQKAVGLAPDDPATGGDDLKASIGVSTKLNKSQKRAVKRGGKNQVEVYVGTADPAGVQQEFGNVNHGPQSFMRPAWAATKMTALKIISEDFAAEILKTAKRLAKRAAKG